MTAPLVILDIGETLVEGPAHGPASRIAAAVGLGQAEKNKLHRLLMTSDFDSPAEAAAVIQQQFAWTGPSVESAVSAVWAAQEGEAELIPGAMRTLEFFEEYGCQLALLSNIWTAYRRSVQRLLGEFFAAHIPPELQLFSCQEGLTKPSPELFEQLLKRARRQPEEVLMLGDSYKNDMAPAIDCGMKSLWLLHNPRRERAALVSILNGQATAPTLTLSALADLDFERFGNSVLPQLFA